MQMVFDAAHISVANGPGNSKVLQIVDAHMPYLMVILTLNPEAARTIGAALQTSLLVAGAPLPKPVNH